MTRVRKCKSCGKEVGATNPTCKECGGYNPLPIYKHWWFWALTILFGVTVVVKSLPSEILLKDSKRLDSKYITNSVSNITPLNKNPIAKDIIMQELDKKEVYLIGEIAQSAPFEIQVLNLDRFNESEYKLPQGGYEYTVVTVAMKNVSDEVQYYNDSFFRLKDKNGTSYEPTSPTLFYNTSLNYGDITPGGVVIGSIIFEIPKNDTKLKLIYVKDDYVSFDVCSTISPFEVMPVGKVTLNSTLSGMHKAVTAKNVDITVDYVEHLRGGGSFTPKDGNEYVVVYITLENIGSEIERYSILNFALQNSTGVRLHEAFSDIDRKTNIGVGELAIGDKLTGTVTFEAPIGDTELGLVYTPDWSLSDGIIISLKEGNPWYTPYLDGIRDFIHTYIIEYNSIKNIL